MAKKYYLSENDVRKLRQLLAERSAPPRTQTKKRPILSGDGSAWVRITSSFSNGGNKWTYGGTVVYPVINTSGALEYRQPVPARQIDEMYNACEAFNMGDPSIRGNGVNSGGADYPTGFAMQPIRGNPVVRAWPIRLEDESLEETRTVYLFTQPNAEDGTCQ